MLAAVNIRPERSPENNYGSVGIRDQVVLSTEGPHPKLDFRTCRKPRFKQISIRVSNAFMDESFVQWHVKHDLSAFAYLARRAATFDASNKHARQGYSDARVRVSL